MNDSDKTTTTLDATALDNVVGGAGAPPVQAGPTSIPGVQLPLPANFNGSVNGVPYRNGQPLPPASYGMIGTPGHK